MAQAAKATDNLSSKSEAASSKMENLSSKAEQVVSQAKNVARDVGSKLENISGKVGLHDFREGELTRAIESQTAKIPSGFFLNMAIGSIGLSAVLAIFARRKPFANFVGLWAPTFLLLGIYNKLVKIEGSDRYEKTAA